MTWDDWIKTISSVAFGSIATTLTNYFQKRGELFLNTSDVELRFIHPQDENPNVKNIQLKLQFINDSGKDMIVKDFRVFFNDSINSEHLNFRTGELNPVGVITAKNSKEISFEVLPTEKYLIFNISRWDDKVYFLDLYFTVNKKEQKKKLDITRYNEI